jgi:hypothetical protein
MIINEDTDMMIATITTTEVTITMTEDIRNTDVTTDAMTNTGTIKMTDIGTTEKNMEIITTVTMTKREVTILVQNKKNSCKPKLAGVLFYQSSFSFVNTQAVRTDKCTFALKKVHSSILGCAIVNKLKDIFFSLCFEIRQSKKQLFTHA